MLTLVQLHVLHISRIPGMDGARALRGNVNPRYHMDARFTNWGKSEQLQLHYLLAIRTDITTIWQLPRFDV
jgi:hypothetical protein